MTHCINCKTCRHIGWSKPRGHFLVTIVLIFFLYFQHFFMKYGVGQVLVYVRIVEAA